MKLEIREQRLRRLPLQVIQHDDGVILKRGALETHIEGSGAAEAVRIVLEATDGTGATRDEILAAFAAPDRAAVESLLDQLVSRRLLSASDTPPPEDTPLEILYWNFGATAAGATRKLNERRLSIVGVNTISRQLVASLRATGVSALPIVDYPLLRNDHFSRADGGVDLDRWPHGDVLDYEAWGASVGPGDVDCLVVTSDFGGRHWMRQWNQLCVANRIHFFPVVLQNLVGHLGPLVVPGETACYECLCARENAHLESPAIARAPEVEAWQGQAVVGYHPSMSSVLGDLAALELTKFYGGALPMRHSGTLIEVNLLQPSISTHKLLKLPRCPVCGPLRDRPAASADRRDFLPGNRIDR